MRRVPQSLPHAASTSRLPAVRTNLEPPGERSSPGPFTLAGLWRIRNCKTKGSRGMHFTKRTISYQLDSDHHLLINTLSGALDIVDGQVYKTAQGLATGDLDTALQLGPELEARFRKRFYLFDTEAEEAAYCEALFKAMKQRLEKEPLQFAICPTYACNLRCTYCFEGQLTAGPVKIMTEDQLDHAFQSIEVLRDRFHPSSEARVILFGGEPLLRPAHSCVEQILLR